MEETYSLTTVLDVYTYSPAMYRCVMLEIQIHLRAEMSQYSAVERFPCNESQCEVYGNYGSLFQGGAFSNLVSSHEFIIKVS